MAEEIKTVEAELRAAFARQEGSLPDLQDVRAGIFAGVARARARRRAGWAAAAAAAVIAVLLTPAALMRIGPFEPLLAQPAAVADRTPTGPLNILLLGLDSTADQLQRSDAILIVHIDATHRSGSVVSLPRDTLVDLPGHGRSKLNAGYAYGGSELASRTISNLTGLTFNAMAVVQFEALGAITDALGGVDMCLQQKVTSHHLGLDSAGRVTSTKPWSKSLVYEQGCQHLVGWQAIDFLRQRYDLPRGALDRDANLRQFLLAMAKRLTDQRIDPARALELLAAAGSGLTVDTGNVAAADMYRAVSGIDPSRVHSIGVPTTPTSGNGSVEYETFTPKATELFDSIRRDTVDEWLAKQGSN